MAKADTRFFSKCACGTQMVTGNACCHKCRADALAYQAEQVRAFVRSLGSQELTKDDHQNALFAAQLAGDAAGLVIL
jgi:hypothetical protein